MGVSSMTGNTLFERAQLMAIWQVSNYPTILNKMGFCDKHDGLCAKTEGCLAGEQLSK